MIFIRIHAGGFAGWTAVPADRFPNAFQPDFSGVFVQNVSQNFLIDHLQFPVSPNEIIQAIQHGSDIADIYRIIQAFIEIGLIKAVDQTLETSFDGIDAVHKKMRPFGLEIIMGYDNLKIIKVKIFLPVCDIRSCHEIIVCRIRALSFTAL